MAGEGDRNVANRPPAPLPDTGQAMAHADQLAHTALETARPALDLANQVLGSAQPHADAYTPRATTADQLGHMRTVAFRAGMAHEVGAMSDRAHAGAGQPGGEELVRVIRDGRMIAVPGRGAEEAARTGATASTHHAEAAAHIRAALGATLSKEELNVFERMFMAHFEGGIPIGEKLHPGQFKFLSKSEKAWAEFFQRFAPFAMAKKLNVGNIELLIFRGLLKDPNQAKAGQQQQKAPALVLVSDMKLMDGKTDKFARLQIQGEGLVQTMSEHQPGDVLGKALLIEIAEKMGGGEELSYLSLSHKVVNPDMVDTSKSPIAEAYRTPEQMKGQAIREGTKDVSQGIALSARTEQLIAEKLDINLKPTRTDLGDLRGAERRGGEARGMPGIELGGLFLDKNKKKRGTGEDSDEPGSQVPYLPWWMAVTRPKKFTGKARWWVPFVYFLCTSSALFAAYYLFRYWMSR